MKYRNCAWMFNWKNDSDVRWCHWWWFMIKCWTDELWFLLNRPAWCNLKPVPTRHRHRQKAASSAINSWCAVKKNVWLSLEVKHWRNHFKIIETQKILEDSTFYQVDVVCPKRANIEPLLWLDRCLEGNPNGWKSQHGHQRDKKLPTDLDGMSMSKKIRDVWGER